MKSSTSTLAVAIILLVGALLFIFHPWGGGDAPHALGSQKSGNPQQGTGDPIQSSPDHKAEKSPVPEGIPAPKAHSPEITFDRQAMAAAFGLRDHGALSEAAKSKIDDRLNRELAGTLKNLENSDPSADQAATWRATISMVKYQEALAMLKRGEYLTVDATALPKNVVAGYDPMTLLSAVTLDDGTRVGVMFPVDAKPGSELEQMNQIANDAAAQQKAVVVTTFNAQPAEVRAERVRDMVDAQNRMEEASRQQDRGEITAEEFASRLRELNPRLPPNGVHIDPQNNTFRR